MSEKDLIFLGAMLLYAGHSAGRACVIHEKENVMNDCIAQSSQAFDKIFKQDFLDTLNVE